MNVLKIWFLLIAFSTVLFGSENNDLPFVICPKGEELPKLDGKLDDKCWQDSGYITDFMNSYGNKFETQRNEVFLFHNNDNLYIGVKCHDKNVANIKKNVSKHDSNIFWDDCIELFISSGKYRSNYLHLLVNALGTRQDFLVNEFTEPAWNGKWKAVSYIGKDFWSSEIVIPFSDFGKTPKNGDIWGFNIAREVRHTNSKVQILAWSPTFQSNLHVPGRFGRICFKKAIPPHISLANHNFNNDSASLLVKTQSRKRLQLETITTIGQEKAVFSEIVDIKGTAKPIKMKLTYFPSWKNFSFYLLAKDPRSGKLLFQTPLYPLSSQPVKPRLSIIKEELNKLKADMIFIEKGATDKAYIVSPVTPFQTILPYDLPNNANVNMPICQKSCQGEYQPISFRIFAKRDMKNVIIKLKKELSCDNNIIKKENVDIRILKTWYQGGKEQKFGTKVLVPELLLKDDNIITINRKTGKNVFNFTGLPLDGPSLKPFKIKAYTGKQIWVTVNVSPETSPGTYRGLIGITSDNTPEQSVPIVLTVLPITLRKPDRILGMYYYNDLFYFYGKNEADLKKDLQDMKEHGLNSIPVLYCKTGFNASSSGTFTTDLTWLNRLLSIHQEIGFRKPFILSFLKNKHFPKALFDMKLKPKQDDTAKLAFIVKQMDSLVKKHKYPDVYFYGIDEPGYDFSGKTLERCRKGFEIIQKAGGKTTTAINLWGYKKLGSSLDMPILDTDVAYSIYDNPATTSTPQQCLTYWHPVEAPCFDRLRFGLMLWKTGLKGAYPYAYRHVYQGNPYYDESLGAAKGKSGERNSMYTYPAQNGPIPTIQWEGVREGIDDLRYLQTLKHWVDLAEKLKNPEIELVQLIKESKSLLKLPPFFHQDFQKVDQNIKAEHFENLKNVITATILKLKARLSKAEIH